MSSQLSPSLRRAGPRPRLFLPLFPDEGRRYIESQQLGQVAGLPRRTLTLIGGSALLVPEFLAIPVRSEGIYLTGPELDFYSNTNEATGRSGDELVGRLSRAVRRGVRYPELIAR